MLAHAGLFPVSRSLGIRMSIHDVGLTKYSVLVETMEPNKSETLPYLHGDKRSPPDTSARVTLDQRGGGLAG